MAIINITRILSEAQKPEERVDAITALASTIKTIGIECFENPSEWNEILEKKAWRIVEKGGDINSLRAFFEGFPASARRSRVQKLILRLERKRTRTSLWQKLGSIAGDMGNKSNAAPRIAAAAQPPSLSRRKILIGASALAVVPGGYGIWRVSQKSSSPSRTLNAYLILEGHTSAVTSGSFSPDGTRIVTVSIDGTARIWRILSNSDRIVLRRHDGFVNSAVFSSRGPRVLTASDDKTARVWDAYLNKRWHNLCIAETRKLPSKLQNPF